jgi:hypothetical protein
MKKIITSFTALSFFCYSFSSCKQEDIDHTVDMAITDGVASAEFVATMCESGACYVFPEYIAIGAAAAGVAASGAVMSITPNPHLPITISLPQNLQVPNNPYENIGVMHNISLNYVVKNIPTTEYHKLMNPLYSKILIDKASQGLSASIEQKTILSKDAASIISQNPEKYEAALQHYFTNNKEDVINNLNLGTNNSTKVKSYVSDFYDKFTKSKGQDITNNIGLINNEIVSVINSNEDENVKKVKLVFLSVYKHSYFFWNNH